MGPIESVQAVFRNYANFDGRGSRPEFWWFVLFWNIALILCILFTIILFVFGIFLLILVIGSLLPYLAVGSRRLHDMGQSGWWQLLYLIPYVGWIPVWIMCAMPSQPHPNKYGPQPMTSNVNPYYQGQQHPYQPPSNQPPPNQTPPPPPHLGGTLQPPNPQPRQQNQYCTQCGTQLQPDARFCNYCGTVV